MPQGELHTLYCRISAGVFSGELIFEIPLPDGSTHTGAGSTRYFMTRDGRRLLQGLAKNEEIDGLVAAKLLKKEGHKVLASVPDGEVIWVDEDQISEHSLASTPSVPV